MILTTIIQEREKGMQNLTAEWTEHKEYAEKFESFHRESIRLVLEYLEKKVHEAYGDKDWTIQVVRNNDLEEVLKVLSSALQEVKEK